MAKSTRSIYISSSSHPKNEFYRQKFNRPQFTILAEAGQGEIYTYPELFKQPQAIIDANQLHEFGHNLASTLRSNNVGFIDVDWGIAMREDGRQVSGYGEFAGKHEDFNESVVAYIASKNTECEIVFKTAFPNRYKKLEEIFSKQNSSSTQGER